MKSLIGLFVLFIVSHAHATAFVPVKIITACAMATNCTSHGVDINQRTQYAIQAVFSGSPMGSLKLQVSSDNVPASQTADPAANVVNWSDYSGSTYAVTGAGTFLWNVFPASYQWVRMVYTASSGSGSLSATFDGKN